MTGSSQETFTRSHSRTLHSDARKTPTGLPSPAIEALSGTISMINSYGHSSAKYLTESMLGFSDVDYHVDTVDSFGEVQLPEQRRHPEAHQVLHEGGISPTESRGYEQVGTGKPPLDMESLSNQGKNPLHMAVEKNHYQIVKLLLQNGADVGAQATNGDSALHIATRAANLEMVRLLLTHGADTSITNAAGETLLHIACNEGHEAIVRHLLETQKSG